MAGTAVPDLLLLPAEPEPEPDPDPELDPMPEPTTPEGWRRGESADMMRWLMGGMAGGGCCWPPESLLF